MHGSHVGRLLPVALLTTATVVLLPAVLVTALPGDLSPFVGVPLCVGLSLAIAHAVAALWRRSAHSSEVLFADLMLWGWLRRMQTERRLAHAASLVSDASGDLDQRVQALARVSAMLESRDAYTRRHSLRVTRHSEAIARGLDLDDAEVARVRTAAALHDVGKFFTPRRILNKPSRLTEEEFAVIKRHPGQGADLLRGVVEPEVEAMIRHHHERLGGGGYPDGLAAEAIPLGARIIAVADTFDAMTSTRTYRAARPHATALTVLRDEAGLLLDARAVEAFESYYFARRETVWSSVVSGLTQTLAPLRELILPATRALPALGAAAVLTVPVIGGALDGRPEGGDRQQAARESVSAAVAPAMAALSETSFRSTDRAERRTAGRALRLRRATGRGPGTTANPRGRDHGHPWAAPGGTSDPIAAAAPQPAPAAPAEPSPGPVPARDDSVPAAAQAPAPEPTATAAAPPALELPEVALPKLPRLPELPDVELPPLPVP